MCGIFFIKRYSTNDTPSTHIWLLTCLTWNKHFNKSGWVKLFLSAQTFRLSELVQSCICFPHVIRMSSLAHSWMCNTLVNKRERKSKRQPRNGQPRDNGNIWAHKTQDTRHKTNKTQNTHRTQETKMMSHIDVTTIPGWPHVTPRARGG